MESPCINNRKKFALNNLLKNPVRTIAGLIVISGLLSIPLAASAEYNYGETGSNWMSYISNSAPLSQLTIPGTHESSSADGGVFPSEAQCQDENIAQQLADGTRYFDFRCENQGHGLPDALAMYHGDFYEGSYLDTSLASIYTFLAAHPTETVLVSFLETDTSTGSAFADDISDYIQANESYWYFGNTTPTLGSVRGKIVLFNRYGTQSNGQTIGIDCLGWEDNVSFCNAGSANYNGGPNVYVQDLYNPPGGINSGTVEANKWTAISQQITNAWGDNNMNNFYFNNLSIAWELPDTQSIEGYAQAMNGDIEPNCTGVYSPHRYGVIYVDWSNSTIAADIYRLNDGPFSQAAHQFVNANSGLVLDGTLNTYNGALVDQYQNVSATQEYWTLYPLGGGLYEIANDYSGNALDIAGGSKSNGGAIDTYGWATSINEEFYLSPDTYGTYEIVSLLDGNVVEIGGNAKSNGAPADQWSWAGTASQRWTVK